jgi:hypothetical protein
VHSVDRLEGHRRPPARSGRRFGERTVGEPSDVASLKRMRHEGAAGGPTVEQQHVHAEPAEAHALTVDNAKETGRLTLDAGLLVYFLHGHLGRRVPHVGPAGWIQPDTRILALHEQDLTVVIANDRSDRHLGRHIPRHTFTDRLNPFADELVTTLLGRTITSSRSLDVAGDVQHLFEAFALVEVLGEPHPGAGNARQRLAPSCKIVGPVVGRVAAYVVGSCHGPNATTSQQCAGHPAGRPIQVSTITGRTAWSRHATTWSRARLISLRWNLSVTSSPADVRT